jgi:cysteine desulfurase
MIPLRTYLDWNATAPLRPQAREAMLAALAVAGNPSSPHAEGRRARAIIESAREQVAALVGARPAEVIFTSGGTEANNAVLGAGWDVIAVSGIEHDSVLTPARKAAKRIVEIPAGRDGVARALTLSACGMAAAAPGRALISLQLANNETGALQPVAATAAWAKKQGIAMHSDAVQAAGRVRVDLRALGVDFLTLSAHKIGGPTGVGALVVSEGASLAAFMIGGGQERRRRAGTENVAGIAGFGAAAEAARNELTQMARVRALRDRIEAGACALAPAAVVIAAEAERLPNTTNIAIPGRTAETLVIAFDLKGVAVSAGAACSSGKVGSGHVLQAMGIEPLLSRAAIRISLGSSSGERDVAAFLEGLADLVARHSERAVA